MDYSVQVVNDNISWQTLKEIAQTVDRGRWRTLWNYDHLVPPTAELLPHISEDVDRFEEGDTFEAWSLLAAWAGLSERVRLGSLVTAIPFRNPALLAKMAATIDHISGGRLELGLGAAWHKSEARAYGIPLGSDKEKLDRFAEGLEVIRLLLTPGGRRDFEGKYFTLDRAPFAPQPVQKKLPILIGGGGEKRTLKLENGELRLSHNLTLTVNLILKPKRWDRAGAKQTMKVFTRLSRPESEKNRFLNEGVRNLEMLRDDKNQNFHLRFESDLYGSSRTLLKLRPLGSNYEHGEWEALLTLPDELIDIGRLSFHSRGELRIKEGQNKLPHASDIAPWLKKQREVLFVIKAPRGGWDPPRWLEQYLQDT